MKILRADYDEMVAHAREEAPDECCGYLWFSDGQIDGVKRGENERHSRYGYELDADSRFQVWKLEEEGVSVGAYHSHPVSPAEPSQTDINLAGEPTWLYVIVSGTHEPRVRGWWIRDGQVTEEELDVVDG